MAVGRFHDLDLCYSNLLEHVMFSGVMWQYDTGGVKSWFDKWKAWGRGDLEVYTEAS